MAATDTRLRIAALAAPASATPTEEVGALGTWACSVPAGKTYTKVANQLNVCNPNGFAYSYLLV
ncbi:MAG: hypothetical protein HOV94_23425 [Saccharothrix sp.]|nr:hypothetical protein [Saccharothrix sp.]